MEPVVSTSDLHPRDKLDHWQSTASRWLAPHDCIAEPKSTFECEMTAGKFANLELVQCRLSAIRVSHTLRHVERTDPAHAFLCYQVQGSMSGNQNGHDFTLEAESLNLLDPLMPYELQFSAGAELLVIKASRQDLRARLGRNKEHSGRSVTSRRLDDKLALQMAASLPSLVGKLASITEEMMGVHVLDLLGLSIARTIENASSRVSTPKAITLGRLRSVVEANLADSELDPQRVAKLVGISVRYANDLLAAQDTSLTRFILARRLARCRLALEDPNQALRTIAEIAQGWGFVDMTHFGRRFKEAYGVSPSHYQQLAARSGQGGRF